MKKYISIDIGGTAIKYGIVSENAEVLLKKEMKTEAQKGGPAILEKVIGIVEELKGEADAGVCISTAGMVDIEKGEIFYSAPLIPNYIGTAFKKTVEERFGIPCEVENDVNCAGLAEYKAGAAAGSKAAVMLTIGTGIGGCILLNGEVFHGFSNSACEVGYPLQFSVGSSFHAATFFVRMLAAPSVWKSLSSICIYPTSHALLLNPWNTSPKTGADITFSKRRKKAMRSVTVQLTRWWMYLEKELPISAM